MSLRVVVLATLMLLHNIHQHSSHEVESSEVESFFCQCDNEDALMECLICRSWFELDTFCPGC
jgi:hypothetical protein